MKSSEKDDGVMKHLFLKEGRKYEVPLDKIFYLLDPSTLLSCLQVCKEWKEHIRYFIVDNVRRRIIQNWFHCKNLRRTHLPLLSPYGNVAHAGPLGLRPDIPRSVVANGQHVVTAILGRIDLYSRKERRHLRRIYSSERNFQWHLSLSSDYLGAKQICDKSGQLLVFKAKEDFQPFSMEESPRSIDNFHMVEGRIVILEYRYSIQGYRINPDSRTYERLWTLSNDLMVYNISREHLVYGEHLGNSKFQLCVHRVTDCSPVHSMELPLDGSYVIKGIAHTKHHAIVILSDAEGQVGGDTRIFLYDMSAKKRLRDFSLNLSDYFGGSTNQEHLQMWCDPHYEIMIMAAKGNFVNSTKILVWNLKGLTAEDGQITKPSNVIETFGFASAEAMAVFRYGLIYPVIENNRVILLETNYWTPNNTH